MASMDTLMCGHGVDGFKLVCGTRRGGSLNMLLCRELWFTSLSFFICLLRKISLGANQVRLLFSDRIYVFENEH